MADCKLTGVPGGRHPSNPARDDVRRPQAHAPLGPHHRGLARAMYDRIGNLHRCRGIFPGYGAPIVRGGKQGRELVLARWAMPSPVSLSNAGKPTSLHKHPESEVAALAPQARAGVPVPGSVHELLGKRAVVRWLEAADLVHSGLGAPPPLLRRHLDPLDVSAEAEGR